MAELLTALALAIALEGILYALFPATMRRFILQVLEMTDAGLRMAGLMAAVQLLQPLPLSVLFWPKTHPRTWLARALRGSSDRSEDFNLLKAFEPFASECCMI